MIDFGMTTSQIIKALKRLGVDFDEEEFVADIRHGTPLSEIGDRWVNESSCRMRDEDFVALAPTVLWKRLAPDVPCIEKIEECVATGYSAIENEQYDVAFSAWRNAWDVFKKIKDPEVKNMSGAASIGLWGGYCFGQWRHSFSEELLNAWKRTKNVAYAEMRAQFSEDYCRILSDEENCSLVLCDAADSHWDAGQTERAEALYKEAIAGRPNDPWLYCLWGNRYFSWQQKDPIRHDYARSEAIYTAGIKSVKGDVSILLDRLRSLYEAADGAGLGHLLKREIDPSKVASVRPKR